MENSSIRWSIKDQKDVFLNGYIEKLAEVITNENVLFVWVLTGGRDILVKRYLMLLKKFYVSVAYAYAYNCWLIRVS